MDKYIIERVTRTTKISLYLIEPTNHTFFFSRIFRQEQKPILLSLITDDFRLAVMTFRFFIANLSVKPRNLITRCACEIAKWFSEGIFFLLSTIIIQLLLKPRYDNIVQKRFKYKIFSNILVLCSHSQARGKKN